MALRIGLLVLGAALFVAIGAAAVSSWIAVFTTGPASPVDTTGFSDRSAEGPAIVAALIATFFSLLALATALIAGRDLARRRRR